ncbi:DUF3050 domain-containing protein [Actinocorallia longicatena]|uniref:DUF3050 domain-containing protein n=1 Tax=Actinocorallia longicatena TaxID=111803 RepID=A0ABP6Q7C5_9ACTN
MSRYDSGERFQGIDELREAVAAERKAVTSHPVYHRLDSLPAVNLFMAHHVFAVWDFMSLLKDLQRELTCVDVPWTPAATRTAGRLINEIVLVEESDARAGGFLSHFELYLEAMDRSGADTTPILELVFQIRDGIELPSALERACAPAPSAMFTLATWELINSAPLHCKAAAFAFGREDLIPEMFDQIAAIEDPSNLLEPFRDYLSRHIEVDAGEHTPMAMRMVADLCGEDPAKWSECAETVAVALRDREKLWNGIMDALERNF